MGGAFPEMVQLAARLNELPRARNLMETFPRTIHFSLTTEGGDPGDFCVRIEGGRMSVTKGAPATADLAVTGKSEAFARVARGELDVSHPIARGELAIVRGRVSEMTLLNRILWAT